MVISECIEVTSSVVGKVASIVGDEVGGITGSSGLAVVGRSVELSIAMSGANCSSGGEFCRRSSLLLLRCSCL